MKKPNRLCAALCLGMAAVVGGGIGAGAGSRAETFEIGVVAPLSGGGADYGMAFQNGIRMAVADVNKAGGVKVGDKSYTLAPVFCDDEFKPDKAVNCGKELASQRKIRALLTPSSLAAFPLMGFNQQEGFVLMATSQTPRFTKMGNKLVVRFINNTDRTMGPWVDLLNAYFKKSGQPVNKAAMMVVNTELGKTWADNFAAAWKKRPGGSVVGSASYNANDTDFYPQLSTLLPNGPDAIILTTVCQPSAIVIKQARELGFKGPFIQSAACSGDELARLLPAEQVNGTIFEVGTWGIEAPEVDAFKKAYQAEFGAPPQAISGEGYDAVRWLARAATIAGTVDSAIKIRAAMPEALGASRNMFNMANLDDKGDIDFPMYVGVIAGGAVSVFTGDR
ncbi:MAG: ABC transporter substrate-binding protein [Janthinobacterium lividum]